MKASPASRGARAISARGIEAPGALVKSLSIERRAGMSRHIRGACNAHMVLCNSEMDDLSSICVCSSSRCEIHGHIEDGDEKLPFCLSPICGNGADFRPWLLRVELHIMGLIGFNFRERPDLISILVIDDC